MTLNSNSNKEQLTLKKADESNSTSNASNTTNSTNTTQPIANTTNVVGSLKYNDTIVSKEPYEISRCDQILQIKAKRITNIDDYSSRGDAFFTMSAYLINMFETNDSSKLIESINLAHIKLIPDILKGSKNCILYQDEFSFKNITLCVEKDELIKALKDGFNNLMKCRMGNSLGEFDPITINKILAASCNGTTNGDFDLPKIKKELIKEFKTAGFEVKQTLTDGKGNFGLSNSTETNATISRTPRKIEYRVPGTY